MSDYFEIREAIDDAITWHKENLPASIAELIGKARHDLYNGPSYYSADGDELSCFDKGAIPFNFSKAVAEIRNWSDKIDDVRISEIFVDDDGEEYESDERIEDSAAAIVKAIVGKDLYSYL